MFLHRLRNALDFPLRQFFRWRRPGLHWRNEPKHALFAALAEPERVAAEAAADRLLTHYPLDYLHAHSRTDNYRENLFYLELLERALEAAAPALPAEINAGDIGPSHWFYVQALYALWTGWRAAAPRAVTLTAYESDAYRVYLDLYSRWDHAHAHLRGLPAERVRYEPRAFPPQPAAFDALTLLFPFVFERDHLEWGLPGPLFSPAALLADAWLSLKPGGVLIIVNQGEAEHHAQRQLLEAHAIPAAAAFRHESQLFHYPLPRYGLAAVKPA
ncbi:MAG: hypothetical protein KA764_07255 [Anaerolineales bacterium]|nr:hypothetical protein [Anaerolineales bacterium]